MYDKQLKTFLAVARCGSFNKAAKQLYVSASAVIQQINNLEQDLGVKLFVRSKQGIVLNDAGKYLAKEAEAYIAKGEEIRTVLKDIAQQVNCINVGTSIEDKCRLLYDLWMLFEPKDGKYEIRLRQLAPGKDIPPGIELVESVRDHVSWQKGWQFQEIFQVPMTYAVSKNHPLINEEMISFDQMRQYSPIVIDRSGGKKVPELYKLLDAQEITYGLAKGWDSSFVWECSVNNRALLVPACWDDVLFDFALKPCEVNISLPYGFFYREDISKNARSFLRFVDDVYSGRDPRGIVPVL